MVSAASDAALATLEADAAPPVSRAPATTAPSRGDADAVAPPPAPREGVPAAPTKPFAFPGGDPPEPAAPACELAGFTLPAGAKVLAAGGYSGRPTDFQIDQSGHQATTMQVAVNEPQVPVALLLGAYEPTVWSVGWTPGTRIAAVVVAGYHRQRITGLPAGTPVLVSSHRERGPCPHAYVGGDGTKGLNPLARQVFGRAVDMAYPARDGQVLVGAGLGEARLETDASAVAADSFRDLNAPPAGQAGIEAALRAGVLRSASAADVAAWEAAHDRQRAPEDVPPVQGGRQRSGPPSMPHRAYVVLREFAIPAGLYGAHSATFYLAPGVPRPTGNPGHSTIRDLATGTCTGAICDMR